MVCLTMLNFRYRLLVPSRDVKLHIDTRKELEWHLQQRTLSMDDISCEINGKDFRNCSYSFGRIITEESFQLILACHPSPGK